MKVLFLPPTPDVTKLHAYMKTNFAIQESNYLTPVGVFDDNLNPLPGHSVETPYFSDKAPYRLIHWQKERPHRSFGNGVSCDNAHTHTWVVLPDGYVLTPAQIATIEAYALNPV